MTLVEDRERVGQERSSRIIASGWTNALVRAVSGLCRHMYEWWAFVELMLAKSTGGVMNGAGERT